MKGIILVVVFCATSAFAGEFYGITMDDTRKVDDKELVLNGMALRKVTRFGLTFKIYVGGLYLEKKSQDSAEIIKSDAVKVVRMQYKRGIERGKIVDGWKKGFKIACYGERKDCNSDFKMFKETIPESRKGSIMELTMYPDKVIVKNEGSKSDRDKEYVLTSNTLSKNLMNIFISEKKPPSKRFRREMLGIAKKK